MIFTVLQIIVQLEQNSEYRASTNNGNTRIQSSSYCISLQTEKGQNRAEQFSRKGPTKITESKNKSHIE